MVKHHCKVCNITLSSEKYLEDHNNGKAHQAMVEKQANLKKLSEQSAFLDGFKKPTTEEQIRQALETFGQVDRVILNKKTGKTAIVEFSNAESVTKLLEQKKLRINENKVTAKPRRTDFDKVEKEAESSSGISQFDLITAIQGKLTGDPSEDLSSIYEKFRRDSTEFVDGFVDKLSLYIQEYFDQPIQIITFGSTSTGMATYDADVDLCFISAQPNGLPSTSTIVDFTLDLMAKNIVDLRKSKIPIGSFNLLEKPEKMKLFTRILNEFRKDTNLITTLTPVPDARCPLVRFTVLNAVKEHPKLPLHFEVSINNFLGVHKSQFTKKALNQDLSLILFVIRLWGRCFNLFKDPAVPTGYWSSYALSLIFVNFCQISGYISEVKISGTETIDGWAIEYEIDEKPAESATLDTFLMDFFKFVTSVFNNPTVLCLKHGRTYTVDEFKEEFKGKVAGDFKYSLVNIQDPIELTHNVTSNVSEHYLKKLRSQGMKAILNLRDDPLQPIFALFAKRSHTNSNSSKAAKNDSPPEKRQKIK